MAQKQLAKQLATFLRKKCDDLPFHRIPHKINILGSTPNWLEPVERNIALNTPANLRRGFYWFVFLTLALLVSTVKAEILLSEYQNKIDIIASNLEVMVKSGKDTEALPLANEWLTNEDVICKQGYEPSGNPQYYLGVAFLNLGNLTNAILEFKKAIPLMEKSVGIDNNYTCLARHYLGAAYIRLDEYSSAQPILEQNVKAIENSKSPDDSIFASTLVQLAYNESKLPDFTNSSLHYHQALKIQEAKYGMDADETIETATSLACLDMQNGDFVESKVLYERVISAKTKSGATNTLDFAIILNYCGSLYDNGFQDQAKAKFYYEEAQHIYEACGEKDESVYSEILLNVGNLQVKLGDYQKAEKSYGKALAIAENVYGNDSPELISYLIHLSDLYIVMENTDKPTALLLRAVDIKHKSEFKEDQEIAVLYRSIAQVNEMTKHYADAEQFLELAIKILEDILGPKHPNTLMVKRDLGHLYTETGQNEKAEPIFRSILKSYQEQFGADDSFVPLVRVDLAVMFQESGDYTNAIDQFKQAKETFQKSFGPDYYRIAGIESGWATCELALNHKQAALIHARNERRISEIFLNRFLTFTSESERLSYIRREGISCDMLCSIGSAQDIAEAIIRNKGIVLDSILEDQIKAQLMHTPKIMALLNELHIANPKLAAPDLVNSYTHEQDQNAGPNKAEEVQKALAENVASPQRLRRALQTSVQDVQSMLSTDTVLLEFVSYYDVSAPKTPEFRYGVLYVGNTNLNFSGLKQGEPGWISLGGTKMIDKNLKQYEQMMRSRDRGNVEILKTLYSELMEPMIRQLPTNVMRIIVCPDAKLNFLSFATLVDPQDKFLAESYQIKYVSSGRDLVYSREATNANPELAVFADPEFNKSPSSPMLTSTNNVNLASLSADRRDYDGYSLPRLPNTEQESQFLSSNCTSWHLKPATFTGTEATEAQVKALHSPYILHLATHGFFLPDTQTTNQTRTLQLDQKPPVVLHNPMQRSGLALAGAELTLDAWKRGEVPDTENDGILMADEVALLDLQNTWLVTLSACDTGIGEARAGEGVLGLRRGFIQAGAQNLLMTLWPVSDKWTVDLMKGFYDEAMRTGNAPNALADVQREYLIKLKKEKNLVFAARLAGPFVMNFQGKP